jgi:GntR family transcriptional regulator
MEKSQEPKVAGQSPRVTGQRLSRGRLPLSMQIGSMLRRRLAEAEWRIGDRLPSLEEFMVEYGVARATMRSALDELEHDGFIERGRGRGTFVIQDMTQDRWLILPTDWPGLVSHIDRLGAKIITIESGSGVPRLTPGEGTLAEAYWRARRVNWSNGVPYSLNTLFLEQQLHDKFAYEFERGPVLPVLANRFKSLVVSATQTLTISSADVEAARHLNLSVGEPIAQVRRVVCDRKGQVSIWPMFSTRRVIFVSRHRCCRRRPRPRSERALVAGCGWNFDI